MPSQPAHCGSLSLPPLRLTSRPPPPGSLHGSHSPGPFASDDYQSTRQCVLQVFCAKMSHLLSLCYRGVSPSAWNQKPWLTPPCPHSTTSHGSQLPQTKSNTAWRSGEEGPVSALQPHPRVSWSSSQPPPGHCPRTAALSPPPSFPGQSSLIPKASSETTCLDHAGLSSAAPTPWQMT